MLNNNRFNASLQAARRPQQVVFAFAIVVSLLTMSCAGAGQTETNDLSAQTDGSAVQQVVADSSEIDGSDSAGNKLPVAGEKGGSCISGGCDDPSLECLYNYSCKDPCQIMICRSIENPDQLSGVCDLLGADSKCPNGSKCSFNPACTVSACPPYTCQ